MRYDLVPVVYSKGRFDEIAPPYSYIDALNFETAEDLAKYLIFLDNDDEAYNQYFL